MFKRVVVLVFLALFTAQTVLLYELTQHVRLGAYALTLIALRPTIQQPAAPPLPKGLVPKTLVASR